jgi:tetratricopeptide (TPR) repeat protein
VNEINTLSVYATILARLGQTEKAEKQYQAAIAAQKALKLNSFLSFSLLDWGDFQLRTARLAGAELTFDEAITLNSDLHHLKLTAQTKLATVYLAQGKSQAALALADKVWQAIEPTGGKGLPLPVNTMYECYSIFKAGDDVRAEAALQMAADVLKRTAAEIEDPEMRTSFLNNVSVNRRLRAILHKSLVEEVEV